MCSGCVFWAWLSGVHSIQICIRICLRVVKIGDGQLNSGHSYKDS